MKYLVSSDNSTPGCYRAMIYWDGSEARVYIPCLSHTTNINVASLPLALFISEEMKKTALIGEAPGYVVFEGANGKRPIITGYFGDGIRSIGGNVSAETSNSSSTGDATVGNVLPGIYTSITLTEKFSATEFASADIKQVPFLSEQQILTILRDSYFGKYSNSRLCVSDKEGLAKQLYNVQTSTGLSVLVSLAIAANETGWCRSFAGSYYNMWNFGANSSKGEFGHYFDNAGGIAPAFQIFHNEFLRQYYTEGNSTVKANGGPWKSLREMESTYCPSPAGWSTVIGKCAVMLMDCIL